MSCQFESQLMSPGRRDSTFRVIGDILKRTRTVFFYS